VAKSAVALCTGSHVLLEVANTAGPVAGCCPADLESTATNGPVATKFFSVSTVSVKTARCRNRDARSEEDSESQRSCDGSIFLFLLHALRLVNLYKNIVEDGLIERNNGWRCSRVEF
jgi:hypothetical protein